jgi:hypothetical protein
VSASQPVARTEADKIAHVLPSADAPQTKASWPLPRGLAGHLTLETTRATVLYWTGLLLVAGAVFVPRLMPCVDYPQHLALSDIARRLADPLAPEHAQFQTNFFTYNGLFHLAVAKLARLVPIELAGRIVVSLSLALLGGGVLALVKVLRRPAWYAALFTPIVFSFSVGWGFANYALATSIGVVALVFVARNLVRPSTAHIFAIAALGLACAFAHVLAMLILCFMAATIALELAWRLTARPGDSRAAHAWRAARRIVVSLAPLLVGCWFCIQVYRREYAWDPGMYRDPKLEGTAPPLWQKIVFFGSFATDLNSDRSDQVILLAALAVLAVAAWRVWRSRRTGAAGAAEESPPLVLPFFAWTAAYLATPMVLVGTHLIFPRLAQGVILGAVLSAPRFAPAIAARAEKCALGIGLVAGLNLVLHCAIYAYETNDASRVIDDLPDGRAATAVVYDASTFAFRNGTLVHMAAYYAARKHGTWAFAFARYLSVPVRFKPGGQPAWPAIGWEFSARDYDPRCKYARAFDLFLLKAPDALASAEEPVVADYVFGKDAGAIKALSHHGQFWAFDTQGLPTDGKL